MDGESTVPLGGTPPQVVVHQGMIYADIGLPSRLPLQAPAHAEATAVTYSTIQRV